MYTHIDRILVVSIVLIVIILHIERTIRGGGWLQTYRGHCLRKGIACAQAET